MTPLEGTAGPTQFSIGRALSESLGVLLRNFKVMAAISLAVAVAEAAIRYLLTGSYDGEASGSGVLSLISYALVTAPSTYITFQDLRGHQPGLGETMSASLQRLPRVIGTTLIVGAAVAVPIIIGVFALIGAGMIWVLILAGAAYALFIFALWYVVVPVQVVENVSFIGGFTRATALTRGRRWAILGLALILVVLVLIIAIVVGLLAEVIAAESPMLSLLLMVPLGAFFTVYGATVPTVTYCLLRLEREGVGIEEIVKVFD